MSIQRRNSGPPEHLVFRILFALSPMASISRVRIRHSGAALQIERKVLLFLGRIHPNKGLVNLLNGWKQIQQGPEGRRPASGQWMLAIAGWDQGGHEKELKTQAANLGLGESVAFLGPKFGEEKDAWLRRCDAFVLPSFSEGLPMAVLEAWSYAKPVLMTPQCNLPVGFSAGAAIQVETSADSIRAGIHTAMEMGDTGRESMGQRGRALVTKDFSWPQVAEQVKKVYDWVLGSGEVPECVELR